jgi:hypothetical protein
MPRQSTASLAVVPIKPAASTRLAPPANLTADQKDLWRATVAALPADFFGKEQTPMLTSYVRHLARANDLERALQTLDPLAPDYLRLSSASVQQTKAALAFARALRLTNQARVEKATAGRAVAAHKAKAAARRPWEAA